MTHSSARPGSEQAPDLEAIERTSREFQAAWAQGGRPDLLHFLEPFTEVSRRHALCELLWIEWDHLRRAGHAPQLGDYCARFAELTDVVDEAWRSDFGRFATEESEKLTVAGRYTILKPHARGGIGQVSLALDQELGRPVALKEIQARHAHSLSIQERFVREAKITGKLEHPGIVPVYSLGTKQDGSPFYATRFIQGNSLHAAIARLHSGSFGDSSELPGAPHDRERGAHSSSSEGCEPSDADSADPGVSDGNSVRSGSRSGAQAARLHRDTFRSRAFRQLLTRFIDVCNIIHYAHSRGVLHRDLKPANILLGKHGETMVVDWGLAKEAGEPEFSEETGGPISALTSASFTTHGALIGTIAYMSPEQAAGRLDQLTPASDLYSLGATLYHLLVGQPPLAGESQERLLERVQRGEIPRPRTVQPRIPRALDAICANAMSQDPGNRYESAAALAEDVEHWLADEAVSAYREPLLSRVARWTRRHQTATTSGLLATVLLALTAVTISILMVINNHQLAQARATAEFRRLAAESAQSKAETERDRAENVTNFLVTSFHNYDPDSNGNLISAADLLRNAFDELKSNTVIDSSTKCRLFITLIHSHLGLGLYPQAASMAEHARDFADSCFPAHDLISLEVRATLADTYLHTSRVSEAIRLLDRALSVSRQEYGHNHVSTLQLQMNLALAYCDAGHLDQALELAHALRSHARTVLPIDHSLHSDADVALADILVSKGDFAQAIRYYTNALSHLERIHGLHHPLVLTCHTSFARLCFLSGQYNTAHDQYVALIERSRRACGDNHPLTLVFKNGLATVLDKLGKPHESIELHNSVLASRLAQLGPAHTFTLNSQFNLANAHLAAGDTQLSIELHEKTLDLRRQLLGEQHPDTLASLNSLGAAYGEADRPDDAVRVLRTTVEARRQILGDNHADTLRATHNLCTQLIRIGQIEEALPLLEQTIEQAELTYGPAHADVTNMKVALAHALRRIGQPLAAVNLYQDVLSRIRKTLGVDAPEVLRIQINLGTALVHANKHDEAVKVYTDTLAQQKRNLGAMHPDTLQTQVSIGVCAYNAGRPEDAIIALEAIKDALPERMGWRHFTAIQCHLALASAYDKCGRSTEADAIFHTVKEKVRSELGNDHPQVIMIVRSYAAYLFRNHRDGEAIASFRECVSQLRATVGIDNVQTLDAVTELAGVLLKTHQYAEAEELFKELYANRTRLQSESRILADLLHSIADCQIHQERYADAEVTFRELLRLHDRTDPHDWQSILVLSELGWVLVLQGKHKEGENLLLNAFDNLNTIRDTIPYRSHESSIRESADRAVKYYRMTGQLKEAQQLELTLGSDPVNEK